MVEMRRFQTQTRWGNVEKTNNRERSRKWRKSLTVKGTETGGILIESGCSSATSTKPVKLYESDKKQPKLTQTFNLLSPLLAGGLHASQSNSFITSWLKKPIETLDRDLLNLLPLCARRGGKVVLWVVVVSPPPPNCPILLAGRERAV